MSEELRDMIQAVVDKATDEYDLDEDAAIDLVINIESTIEDAGKH